MKFQRAKDQMLGYATLGPLQAEWGDGIVLRFGRFYVAWRFRLGRSW